MTTSVFFDCLSDGKKRSSTNPAEIFHDWSGPDERWLFVAPHDDDILIGAGLSFLSAITLGIETHAVIVSNGRMGYCRAEQKETIAAIRAREARQSYESMGLPPERLHFFNYPDCHFHIDSGRRFVDEQAEQGGPHVIAGATGLQNSFTWALRQIRPTRLFLPSITDIHPDHRAVTTELTISIFHAHGGIWPELGPKTDALPHLYEYATYSNFLTPPTIRVRTSAELFEKKLAAIAMYRSQEQINLVVDVQRQAGPKEFLREVRFDIFQPEKCDELFESR